jgi:hypothetical protein
MRVDSDDSQGLTKFFGPEGETESLPTAQTQADGKFLIQDLEPGQYRLSVFCNGYVEQTFGRKDTMGLGTIINLGPGEKLRNLTFRLVQAGVITGRVRDPAGDPVVGVEVVLFKLAFAGGRQTLSYFGDSVKTDDRGEYRLYWVPPGRYYVRVRRPSGSPTEKFVKDPSLSAAYYPGVTDSSSAAAIDLAAGAELGAVDIILPRVSGYKIRGRLIEASTGKPPKTADVHVRPKKASVFEEHEGMESGQYNSKTGEFEIRNVPPGSYFLTANSRTGFNDPISQERLAEIRTGADIFKSFWGAGPVAAVQMSVDMNAADLNDVVLVLSEGTSVPVQLRVEGAELTSIQAVDDIGILLAPENPDLPFRQSNRFSTEGVARIDNVLTGPYTVNVDFPPAANVYIKELLYGRSDVLHSPIEITNQQPGTISVLLSTKGAQIEGRLTDALSQPVGGTAVMLIPEDRARYSLYKTVITDREGRYVFRAVAPGGYKVFSWEDIGDGDYYDSRVLSKYETQGRPVRLQESAKETVDLRIIPGEVR